MIFVDTSAWFASAVPKDDDYLFAKQWLLQNKRRLVTSDYVIDETLTLLRARGEYQRAIEFGDGIFTNNLADIH